MGDWADDNNSATCYSNRPLAIHRQWCENAKKGLVMLAAWTDILTKTKFMGNEVWRWAALFGVLLASLVAGKVISFFLGRQAERLRAAGRVGPTGMLLGSLAGPATLLMLAGGLYLAEMFVLMDQTVAGFWANACKTVAVLAGAWFIFRLVDIVELFLLKWTGRTETQLDDQLVPLIRKSLRVFVVIVALLFIAQNIFRWDIGALIAGLGIGGLAIALAAKDALANLFGSVTIFSDRPFQLGDRIKIAGHDGFVEEVGFRSTRIRTLMGHQVIVPNSVVANEAVENIGRRPYLKRVMNVTVTYDTSPEDLQRGVDILREMLAARKEHFASDMPSQVYFSDFNADSLNVVVYYWFTPPDWWAYLAFNHDFNMELLRRFNEAGIEFAFPTQTLYLKHGSPPGGLGQASDRPSVQT